MLSFFIYHLHSQIMYNLSLKRQKPPFPSDGGIQWPFDISMKSKIFCGKKVFIRVDFNVPLDEHQNITEDTRIRAVLPTINYALDAKAKDHSCLPSRSSEGGAKAEVLHGTRCQTPFQAPRQRSRPCPGLHRRRSRKMIDAMQPGDVLMLENVRFYEGEEKNDENFAKALANGCDIYVNDAFAVSHRAHASVEAITRFFPVVAAGFLMKNEMNYFEKAMKNPIRPLVAILGGAKVSGKLEVLGNLLNKVDKIIIGGGMAFTFLKALGYNVGKSLVEEDLLETARNTYNLAREKGIKFYLPVDCVAADRFNPEAETKVTTIQEIPDGVDGTRYRTGNRNPVHRGSSELQKPSSGTALWVSLKWMHFPAAPSPWLPP